MGAIGTTKRAVRLGMYAIVGVVLIAIVSALLSLVLPFSAYEAGWVIGGILKWLVPLAVVAYGLKWVYGRVR